VGTLMFVVQGSRVLLIEKKTGHGAGRVNGPGGKLERNESPVDCAKRETFEEVGIHVAHPRHVAQLKFVDTQWLQWLGYAFVAHEFTGRPTESAEAKPFWCDLDALPLGRMWEDDRYWLPRVLPTAHQISLGSLLCGEFLFAAGKLLAHRCFERSAPCE